MANSVVSVTELARQRGSIGERGLDYRRVFRVELSNNDQGSLLALDATGVPKLNEVITTSMTLIDGGSAVNVSMACHDKTVRQTSEEEHALYEVECKYHAPWLRPESGHQGGTPFDAPATVEWGFRTEMIVVDAAYLVDNNGADIDFREVRNSAGEVFVPPLEQELYIPTLMVRRNETMAQYSPVGASALIGSVNAESGYIGDVSFGPNQLRIHNIGGSRQHYWGGFYWDVTYEFDVDPNSEAGFRDVLDQGTYYLDSSGDRINFTDDDGIE